MRSSLVVLFLVPPDHLHANVLRLVEPSLKTIPLARGFKVKLTQKLGDDFNDLAPRNLYPLLAGYRMLQ